MTKDEIATLNVMTHPDRWALRPLLPLVNPNKKDNIGWAVGVLVEAPLGRFVWYEGANIAERDSLANEQAMKDAKVFLAFQLEDLIKEGWVVD